ncbi:MAG: DNA translocase FtsK 4TM domain-containing protein [Lachnospiraceae bacterium]|nr:DNA translocase FtsK 4TM domain-containing protein [Lachnospiraceae bacterium]
MAQGSKNQKASDSGSRKAGSGRAGSSKSQKNQEEFIQEEVPAFLRAEVMIIISFAAAVLLFLSNFHLCGVVGDFLRSIQLGLFGVVGYTVPVLIFVGTSFYLANAGNRKAVIKLSAVIAAALTLCGAAQMIFGTRLEEGQSVLAFYQISGQNGSGGGLVGGLLSFCLQSVVGNIGTYLIYLVVLIICGVCITEKSFVNAVKTGSDKAYQYAREDAMRRREEREERQEERRRLREENVVRGVDLSATKIQQIPLPEEEGMSLDGLTEKLSARGRKKKPFEDELLKEEALLRSEFPDSDDADVELEQKTSSADVFTGRIALPPEYEEPVPFEEDRKPDAAEDEDKPEEKIVSFTKKASGRKNEPLYADKRTMTLEEMDVSLPVPDLPGPDNGYEDDGFIPEAPVTRTYSTGRAERQAYRQEIAADAGTGRQAYAQKSAESSKEQAARQDTAGLQALETVRRNLEKQSSVSFLDELDADGSDMEEINTGLPEPASVDTEHYQEEKTESGINYDSIFVPEAPKRVVTATGKVIETETELLHKKIEKKRQEAAEENTQASVQAAVKPYVFPPTSLLKRSSRSTGSFSDREYKETAIKLQQTLRNFGVGVTVTDISCGPSVTRYELHPEQGVKVSKIVGLSDDIKLSLAAAEIRIEAPIPGKSAVGIEVPNKENSIVYLRDLLESDGFKNSKSKLTFAVGKDIGGQPVMADIAKMPHLLIAGATGSGKSVCINTLIMSIIYKADPEDVKLIMVDPKVVELSVYNGIPHLLIPVVTDPKKASGALNWAVAEMTDRYKKFAEYNVRDLKGYNEKIQNLDVPEEKRPKKLPQIVIIIDELADLMMVVPGEVEDAICRLAQLARAAGIHLVIATQRPSVNVITGLIKANVPSRIAFSVSSGVDSRTIIDMNGAEKLLGKGDMLFYPSGFPKPQRVQGAFVSDQEVSQVVEFLTEQGLTANYNQEVENRMMNPVSETPGGGDNSRDEYFAQAGKVIIEKEKASIGMLQRVFKIGFNRAARIMDQLAEAGVVGEEEGTKPRKVLMTMEEFEQFLAS